MNGNLMNFCSGIISTFSQFSTVPVRYRYYADKIARGPIAKKYGYEEKIFKSGVLPRLKNAGPLPMPLYTPGNPWTTEKCTFGQNDYIDILGGGKIRPYEVTYNVPKWLRGRKGNEYQLLLLKKRFYTHTKLQHDHPKLWENINKRIRYLYHYLNNKTKTNLMKA
ncbi:hypothetical protein RUM43_007451 [Polyplax serrata]|uniref:Large ribosomal subunit protein mL51 n=1 Tax=Polyplax serrata TaxID=468196 RepID=A0AAN8SA67_POLSC